MSPRDFLQHVVQPNVAEFDVHYSDIRHAFNAALSADALAAHIYDGAGRKLGTGVATDSAFKRELGANSSDFALVHDVANALRHVQLDRTSRKITRVEQVSPQNLGWDEARCDEARWDSPLQVVVTTDAGEKRALEAVVRNAIDFLEAEMLRLNL